MSFHVVYVGSPDRIKAKLAEESGRLTGNSKAEFDTILPALNTILDQQVGNSAIHLTANGHANFGGDGVKTSGQCQVEIKTVGTLA